MVFPSTDSGTIISSDTGLQLRFFGDVCVSAKVEEGSAAATVCLRAGDEMVSVNTVPLSGSRQEAISLVKSSHRTLALVVRRYQRTGKSSFMPSEICTKCDFKSDKTLKMSIFWEQKTAFSMNVNAKDDRRGQLSRPVLKA